MAGPFFAAPVANAATYYWQTSAGDWSNASFWGGTGPTSNDTAYIDNGGTASVSLGGTTAQYLYLGDAVGSGAVNMAGGSLAASEEDVGCSGTGSFTQSGGANTVAGCLYLGTNSTGNGTYNLNGGTLTLGGLSQGSGTAALNLGGGTLQAGGALSTSVPMTLTGTGGNATIDTQGNAVSFSGLLSGVGGFNKLGSGTLTLSRRTPTTATPF